MVTIDNLEVRFDLDGGDDEAVFARLFERHIATWCRGKEDRDRLRHQSERDRALGDEPTPGAGW